MPERVVSWLYHDVTDSPAESGFQNAMAQAYKHSVDRFTFDLALILAGNCTVRTVRDLARKANDGTRIAFLTFDDGGNSGMTVAEILERNGVRGHFFISTTRIGSPGFLSKDTIRALHQSGHVIGSHTHSHFDPFNRLNPDEMLYEWKTCVEILQDTVGDEIVAGSVPGGKINDNVVSAASKAGLRYIFTSRPT